MDFSPLYQACLTVIIGVAVFALGQVVVSFLVEPVNKLSEAIGEVLDALVFYANIYTNPMQTSATSEMKDDRKKAQNELRQKATLLMSRASRVRWYGLASFFKVIPRKENVKKAQHELIFLSNSCFSCDPLKTFESSEQITKLLA
jgi:hypothetical protein